MPSDPLPLGQALALGAIQGPAELLPVSSSGHLIAVPVLVGWHYGELDAELRKSFEVAVHAGTAAALLIGLREDVREYVASFGWQNALGLLLSFAPAAAVALRFERVIERRLSRPMPVAIGLVAGSAAMLIADGKPQLRDREDTTLRDALLIGSAQALALAPGVSRNGATLTAARLLRFKRADANVISRQIALPVIVGASALKTVRLVKSRRLSRELGIRMGAGALTAFASTLASLRLIKMLERSRSLRPYAAYRIGLAVAVAAKQARTRRGAIQ